MLSSKDLFYDALVYTTEFIRQKTDQNKNVAAAFLNFSKAFDSINHVIFLKNLGRSGVGSKTIKLIESFISERKQRFLINNVNSDEINLERGVPQGTVLGPLLFNNYVNDLRYQIDKNCEVVQYADDTLLLASSPIQQECKTFIEKNVILLTKYFTSLKLQLNPSKTEFILFSCNRDFSESESIKVGNKIITESKSVKYLGVPFDKNLSVQENLLKKMSLKSLNLLKKMARGIRTICTLRNRIPTFLMQKF